MKRQSSRSIWLPIATVALIVGIVLVLDLFTREWLPLPWYLGAAAAGLLIAGPVAYGLKPSDYTGERPIREVGSGMGQ